MCHNKVSSVKDSHLTSPVSALHQLHTSNIIWLPPDFEADLQEVWSVRKNIHHSGKPMGTVSPNVAVKAGMYSRHGAVPAQQTQGPQIVTTRETLNKGSRALQPALPCSH